LLLKYHDFLRFVPIYGIDVPTDSRSAAQYQAHNYVVSEPYVLDGLEFGWTRPRASLPSGCMAPRQNAFAAPGC
jgi:hypothetical protein